MTAPSLEGDRPSELPPPPRLPLESVVDLPPVLTDPDRNRAMPEIVLATINARYSHASLGLRCLLANLGELAPRAAMLEFVLGQRTPIFTR